MAGSELDALAWRLVAPLRAGDALPGGAVLVDVTTDLAIAYTLVLGDQRVDVEVMPIAGARTERVRTAHFALGHRGGTMRDADALALCRVLAAIVATHEDAALAELRAGSRDDGRIREVATGRALVAATTAPLHYALSPYRGCSVGCRFCYAQSRLQPTRALLGLADAAWGSWVDAHVDMPAVLAGELARLPCAPIKFCPIVADPYQAVERKLRITRRCVETIAASERVWPTLVLTRAHAVLDDLALWSSLPRAWVGVSLPTADDRVRRHFEPRAATVAERLEVLRRFAAAGTPTFAVVQPMLPGDVDVLADALRDATAGVALGALEGEEQAGPAFDAYPDARTAPWQRARIDALRQALAARDVPVWSGELPPGASP